MHHYSALTYITVTGAVVLIAAVFALTEGDRAQAGVGLVLGGAMIVVSEWTRWRTGR
jgi:hypothetical protein